MSSAVRADNDNNDSIWTGPFAWRRHWPWVLVALLFGIAFSAGCSLVLKGFVPGIQ